MGIPLLNLRNFNMGIYKQFCATFLQVLQNRRIRITCRARKSDHIANNTLYHKLNILEIKDIYHLEIAKIVYLYRNNKLPKLFNHYYKSVNSVHNYNTRNAESQKLPLIFNSF